MKNTLHTYPTTPTKFREQLMDALPKWETWRKSVGIVEWESGEVSVLLRAETLPNAGYGMIDVALFSYKGKVPVCLNSGKGLTPLEVAWRIVKAWVRIASPETLDPFPPQPYDMHLAKLLRDLPELYHFAPRKDGWALAKIVDGRRVFHTHNLYDTFVGWGALKHGGPEIWAKPVEDLGKWVAAAVKELEQIPANFSVT